jgi:hypothetical protein
MAKDKKSFILYSDLLTVIKKITEQDRVKKTNDAGELFLHILEYVNDNNPDPVNFLVDMAFEPIKLSLKRDLKKYDSYIEKQSVNGKKGGRPKKAELTEITQPFILEPKKADSVSVNDNVKEVISIYDRKLKFSTTLIPFLDLYDKDLIRAFCDYWTEHGDKDKKMRFEKEKSFGLSRRLATWNKNNFGNNNTNKKQTQDELTQLTNRLRGLD